MRNIFYTVILLGSHLSEIRYIKLTVQIIKSIVYQFEKLIFNIIKKKSITLVSPKHESFTDIFQHISLPIRLD